MNEERRERGVKWRVGIFVLVALATFLGTIYALGARARLFEARYVVHADFTEVAGLAEGATARLAGVQIGRVTGVHLPPQPGGRVRVDLTIGKQFADRIRKDSIARIETQGLLGDKIVEISVGTAETPPLGPGDVLATRDPADFSKAMAAGAETMKNVAALVDSLKESKVVDNVSGAAASARRLTEQFERIGQQVEKGPSWAHTLLYEEPVALRRLNDVIQSTQRVLDRVERGEGAAGVLTSPQSTEAAKRLVGLMDRLGRLGDGSDKDDGLMAALLFDPKYKALLDDLRTTTQNLRSVSERIAGGRGTLGSLVRDEPGDQNMRGTMDDLRTTIANLKEITEKLNSGEGTIGALIADPTIYERLVAILDGTQRSFLLRMLIRGLGKDGDKKSGAASSDTGKGADTK
ncbi:MAG: MCE family protein [Candidatus Rokubacteria bacterium]|nr:MCE family protein [Candidatus Rokubacteria bacterium]